MTFLLILRFLGDASIYYAFAGFFARCSGGGNVLPGLLIPALCYGLSQRLSGRTARYAVLLPCLLCLFLPGLAMADRVLALPPVVYAVLLVRQENYGLSAYRQGDVFGFFWKAYPAFFLIFAVIGGWKQLCAASLPAAATALIVSVFLMRVLRHDPEIYLQARFLARSAAPLAALGALAWVLSIPAVLSVLKRGLYAVYSVTVAPLLYAVGYVMAWILMHTLYPLMRLLFSLLHRENEEQELEVTAGSFAEQLQQENTEPNPTALLVLKIIGGAVVVVIAVLLLILLYRRLAGDRTGEAAPSSVTQRRSEAIREEPKSEHSLFSRDPAAQVRRQYRLYLKLCGEKGFTPHISYTTEDIGRNTAQLFPDPEKAEELRQLYLQARYHHSATAEDAKRARELMKELREEVGSR